VEKTGALYVVSTPIGNLEDITLRALRVLKEADLIAAEDTRHTTKLLRCYSINTSMISFFEQNKLKRGPYLIRVLKEGRSVALVTDAGTPTLSDPGFYLVNLALKEGITTVPVPGASAAVCALSVSGIPFKSFAFEGFLPSRKGPRIKRLKELAFETRPQIFFESPRRLKQTLRDIMSIMGDREAVVGKEMTKVHETFYRGRTGDILEHLERDGVRGEYTVVVKGTLATPPHQTSILENLEKAAAETNLSMKEIVGLVARKRKIPKKEVYRESLKLKED